MRASAGDAAAAVLGGLPRTAGETGRPLGAPLAAGHEGRPSVLYVGPLSGTSRHRHDAFVRLGHPTTPLEPRRLLPVSPWIDRIEWHLSPAWPGRWLLPRLRAALGTRRFDLAFVDNGSLLTPAAVRLLGQHCTAVVAFNHDDPYGARDRLRFANFRAALPEYDLVTVVRPCNVGEARALGARRVLLHPMVADDVAHQPQPMSEAQRRQWASDVAFVGSWMPERGPFLAQLIRRGLPLALYGGGWTKAREWPQLQRHFRADHLEGDAYAWAVQAARISLGLLSRGNRDGHTTRSTEIPMLGSLLCAERSDEHLAMYAEGSEAVFWRDADDCADRCLELLADEPRRAAIAAAGQQRARHNRLTSEHLIESVVDQVRDRLAAGPRGRC